MKVPRAHAATAERPDASSSSAGSPEKQGASAIDSVSKVETAPTNSRPGEPETALTIDVLRRKLDAAIVAEAWEAVKAIRERMIEVERAAAGNVIAIESHTRRGR
jgi:hypothetical protein